MRRRKQPESKRNFGKMHFYALVFVFVYFVFSNAVFLSLVTNKNLYISTLGPLLFGILSGFLFLYLFSHKDFFGFMGILEKEEKGRENGYLNEFVKYGKYIASILVSQIGGPLFLALTVRFLFSKNQNRYLIVFISTVASTVFGVAIAKGLLRII